MTFGFRHYKELSPKSPMWSSALSDFLTTYAIQQIYWQFWFLHTSASAYNAHSFGAIYSPGNVREQQKEKNNTTNLIMRK